MNANFLLYFQAVFVLLPATHCSTGSCGFHQLRYLYLHLYSHCIFFPPSIKIVSRRYKLCSLLPIGKEVSRSYQQSSFCILYLFLILHMHLYYFFVFVLVKVLMFSETITCVACCCLLVKGFTSHSFQDLQLHLHFFYL